MRFVLICVDLCAKGALPKWPSGTFVGTLFCIRVTPIGKNGGSRRLSQKRERKRVALGTSSDVVRRVLVYTRASISLFPKVLKIIEIGCQKGAILDTFLDRKVAGGGLGVDLASQRGVRKGSAKKGSPQGVQGYRPREGGSL